MFTIINEVAAPESQVTVYLLDDVIAGVVIVREALQVDAGIVCDTPGPLTVHEVLIPVPEIVSVLVVPERTRVGEAVTVTDGEEQLGA